MASGDVPAPVRKDDQDAGLTIAEGGTAEVALSADDGRTFVEILNPSTETEVLHFRFDGTAAADKTSRSLIAGQSWWSPPNFCPIGVLSVLAATTGHVVVIKYRSGA